LFEYITANEVITQNCMKNMDGLKLGGSGEVAEKCSDLRYF
jgi:hypothetical protein